MRPSISKHGRFSTKRLFSVESSLTVDITVYLAHLKRRECFRSLAPLLRVDWLLQQRSDTAKADVWRGLGGEAHILVDCLTITVTAAIAVRAFPYSGVIAEDDSFCIPEAIPYESGSRIHQRI